MKGERLHKISLLLILYYLFLATKAFSSETWAQVDIESQRIQTLLTTPYGIFAGEFDGRPILPKPFNGVFKSIDLGKTYEKSGLNNKGINGLTIKDTKLFAATYYTDYTPAGVYVSDNFGDSWRHAGLPYSGLSITNTDASILFGTAANGLYTSQDNGNTWTQTIGNGFSPGIKALYGHKNFALAAAQDNKVYLSIDNGLNWAEIQALKGKIVNSLLINDSIMLVGTGNNDGYYASSDNGFTWSKGVLNKDKSFGSFFQLKDSIYASTFSTTFNTYGLFISSDNGITWTDKSEGLSNIGTTSASISHVSPGFVKIFITFNGLGLFSEEQPIITKKIISFLDLPFHYGDFNEDVHNITSFFDHEYPFLGYSSFSEPLETTNSTLNYLGIKGVEPFMYYSSHNGIDFPIDFGKEVKAAAEGNASYYFGLDSGHTIKVTHDNGYQTWYMHLKSEGLLINNQNEEKWVNKGDTIGYVGLSGNTNGPHIHFSVIKDVNEDNLFNENDFPDGIVDPFGWQSDFQADPWENFTWEDSKGTHTGSKSYYLWEKDLETGDALLNTKGAQLSTEQIIINVPSNATQNSGLLNLIVTPLLNYFGLEWVDGLGVVVKYTDITGYPLTSFNKDYEISFDYSKSNLINIKEETLKIYKWDTRQNNYQPIPSAVNTDVKKITGLTTSLGHFGVFGEKKDIIPPQTLVELKGVEKEGKFISEVEVKFVSNDTIEGLGTKATYYSLDNGINWKQVENNESLNIGNIGEYKLLYKSEDNALNMEETKEIQFEILNVNFTSSVKIVRTIFKT